MSAVTDDGLVILLDRIQALAIDAHKAMRVIGLETKVRDQANDLARLHSDFAAAEKKIYEWAEYAGSLRGAIDAIDPKATKSKRIVLPEQPKPLETDIPF